MNKLIKIGLITLLSICLFNVSYGFYQLMRFVALIGFSALAYFAKQEKKKNEIIIFIILAILFQPLLKIELGKALWNAVDVIVACGLLVSLFVELKKGKCKCEKKTVNNSV